uniref:Uncharacterized protein n=1 Tax=Arundo donax TaxID=35708 RepID=A0A0A9GDH4_ARUDO
MLMSMVCLNPMACVSVFSPSLHVPFVISLLCLYSPDLYQGQRVLFEGIIFHVHLCSKLTMQYLILQVVVLYTKNVSWMIG